MANVERLKILRKVIQANQESFYMYTWDCGTTKCIAGWACSLFDSDYGNGYGKNGCMYYYNAKNFLELTDDQAKNLFLPDELVNDANKVHLEYLDKLINNEA
jgi:hypothetical protein